MHRSPSGRGQKMRRSSVCDARQPPRKACSAHHRRCPFPTCSHSLQQSHWPSSNPLRSRSTSRCPRRSCVPGQSTWQRSPTPSAAMHSGLFPPRPGAACRQSSNEARTLLRSFAPPQARDPVPQRGHHSPPAMSSGHRRGFRRGYGPLRGQPVPSIAPAKASSSPLSVCSTAHCAASSEKLPGPRAANLSLRSFSRQAFPLLFLSLCGASVPFRVPVYLMPCFRLSDSVFLSICFRVPLYLLPCFRYLLPCFRLLLRCLSLRSVLETHHAGDDYVHSYRCLCPRSVLQTQPEHPSHRD